MSQLDAVLLVSIVVTAVALGAIELRGSETVRVQSPQFG